MSLIHLSNSKVFLIGSKSGISCSSKVCLVILLNDPQQTVSLQIFINSLYLDMLVIYSPRFSNCSTISKNWTTMLISLSFSSLPIPFNSIFLDKLQEIFNRYLCHLGDHLLFFITQDLVFLSIDSKEITKYCVLFVCTPCIDLYYCILMLIVLVILD